MSGLSTMQAGREELGYELTVVYVPNDASVLSTAINSTVADATSAGFNVYSMDVDGEKTLAYPIRGKGGGEYPRGIFAYFILSGNGCAYELSSALDANNQILRYLLVKQQLKRNLKEYK